MDNSKVKNIKALLFMKQHSERVSQKNIRIFAGKPLFHWILLELEKSKYISEIIINTDSEEIAKSAIENFNVTIHMRPEYLLKINSNEANLIMEYDLSITEGEYFFQTHSTNPLLKVETIDKSIEAFFSNNEYDSLFSVTPMQKRLFFESGNPINHETGKLIKTQELPTVYEENSCIYIFSRKSFVKNKNRIGQKPLLYPIDRIEAVDIDDMNDFIIAECIMKKRLNEEK